VVSEAVAAGIKEIVLVTHSSKNSIENHFDTSFELEATLEKRVKRQLLAEIQSICPKDVTIIQVRQGEAKGLGHAINCAAPIIGDAPFVVMLPDVLIDDAASDLATDNLAEMLVRYQETGKSQIMVEPVAHEEVNKFGIADIGDVTLDAGASCDLNVLVEKPDVDQAPSNLAVVGRYVLSEKIWPLLAKTPLGAGDEIQLTDAIAMLMNDDAVQAYAIKGRSHDCGSKLGYLQANIEYALRRTEFADDLKAHIKTIL
jgi:UTP--glucose-1-phosphate uridylyltransferase